MKDVMYRAHIVQYPDFEEYTPQEYDKATLKSQGYEPDTARRPVGWRPDNDYLERFGTDRWFEPDTNKWFKSRSSARQRVELLRAAGYTAIVQRSAPVVWPAPGHTTVPADTTTEPADTQPNVAEAIKVVKAAGFGVALGGQTL